MKFQAPETVTLLEGYKRTVYIFGASELRPVELSSGNMTGFSMIKFCLPEVLLF